MRRINGFMAAFVATTATVALLGASLATADEVAVDGDAVAPISSSALSFGNVCANTTTSKDVLFAILRGPNTNLNQTYNAGSTVAVAIGTPNDARISATFQPTSQNTITLPSTWLGAAKDTPSPSLTSRVRFAAGAAGTTLNASIAYTATGTGQTNNTVTRTGHLSVTASVVRCDTTPPTLNLPTDSTHEATSSAGAVVNYTATATDTVPTNPAVACAPPSGSTFPLGTTVVSCSSTDAAGNTANGSFSVTVADRTGPVITGTPGGVAADATGPAGAEVTYPNPAATDAVDGARPVTCSPASGSAFPLGSTTVTCSASDSRGNVSQSAFVVTVSDTGAPTLVVPGTVTVEATGPDGATATYVATATDLVDTDVEVACSPPSGSQFALGTTAVRCEAVDDAANTADDEFEVSVVDTTGPVVDAPDSFSVEATGPAGAAAAFDVTAADAVDGVRPVSCDATSGAMFPLGSTTVSCSSADDRGNSTPVSFVVTVVDTSAPAVTLPADVTVEAAGPHGSEVDFLATALDVVDGPLAVTCDSPSGSAFAVGQTTVRCHATDTHGNRAQGSFTVTVTDTTSPIVDVPDPIVAEATSAAGAAVIFAASADDLVDGAIEPICSISSGATFGLGITEVSCSATDGAGNTSDDSFTISVVDTTPPTIEGTPTLTSAEASGSSGAVVSYDAPTATDLVDGDVEVSCEPASGSTFPLGETPVECSAIDQAGNRATTGFTVTVSDTTAPVLSTLDDLVEEATGPDGATVSFTATAFDLVDGDTVAVTCDPVSGSTFPLGVTTVGCAATDVAGNEATDDFTITVVDTTAPELTVPDGIGDVEATGPSGAAVTFEVSAVDAVTGVVVPDCSAASGDVFPLGLTTVTCTATDAVGNTSEASAFDVTVVDTTAPSVAVPDDITAEATSSLGAPVAFTSTATDLVDGTVVSTCTPAAGQFPLGSTVVTCAASDNAGNGSSDAFTVTVVDTTAPALDLPDGDVVAEATSPDGATVTYEAAATDAVDGSVTPSCLPTSGTRFALGSTTVACTVVDQAGNAATGSFLVVVRDTTEPTIGALTDITEEATGPAGAVVEYDNPEATDLVSGIVPVTCAPSSGSTFPLDEVTEVTCTATDGAGNRASATFTITVGDETAPMLTLPADIVAEATGPGGAVVAFTASASDAVDGPFAATCAPSTGSSFPLGSTTVGCSATDAHGNSSQGDFAVTVVDSTAPALSVPDDRTVEATGPSGAPITFAASALDLVDGAVDPSCSRRSGDVFPLGDTQVSCSVTDDAGNTATASFTITVVDTTRPQLDLPSGRAAVATGPGGAPVSWTASAFDVVDGPLAPVCTPVSGSTFATGTTTVNCSASDSSGNVATGQFTVEVTFNLSGNLLAPVNPHALNVARAGSTIPLKWQVPAAGGGYVTSTAIVTGFGATLVSCDSGAPIDSVDFTTTGGTSLRYDSTANQYVQNWATPRRVGCYRVVVGFVGGQQLTASFSLR